MSDPNSPILDFYPTEFEADMNGKKQEWEAVVKIPFIDEQRLLRTMASQSLFFISRIKRRLNSRLNFVPCFFYIAREHRLTADEKARNTHGRSFRFLYNDSVDASYPSSLPGFFPDIARSRSLTETFTLPSLDGLDLIEGLLRGAKLGSSALAGFPSVNTLPQHAQLGFHGVNVHNSDSKNQSMVVTVENVWEKEKIEEIAKKVIGKRTFTGWPFLREGKVVAVSDELFTYSETVIGGRRKIVSVPHEGAGPFQWKKKADSIEHRYSKRFGVLIGDVNVLLHVRPLKGWFFFSSMSLESWIVCVDIVGWHGIGLKLLDDGAFVKEYEDQNKEIEQALQLSVLKVEYEDERYIVSCDLFS